MCYSGKCRYEFGGNLNSPPGDCNLPGTKRPYDALCIESEMEQLSNDEPIKQKWLSIKNDVEIYDKRKKMWWIARQQGEPSQIL